MLLSYIHPYWFFFFFAYFLVLNFLNNLYWAFLFYHHIFFSLLKNSIYICCILSIFLQIYFEWQFQPCLNSNPFYGWRTKYYKMVYHMWDGLFYVSTIGCLCIWLNIILDVSVRVFFSSSSDHSYFLNINFRYTVQWLDIYVICEVTPLNYSSTYVALYTAIMIIMTKFPILYSKVSVWQFWKY